MGQIKEQFGVLILMGLVVILLGVLWVFRTDHDVVLTISTWIAGVIGAIINLVTGKPQHAAQQSTISASTVNQVVEGDTKPVVV